MTLPVTISIPGYVPQTVQLQPVVVAPPANTAPKVVILAPSNGLTFAVGASISFIGSASDAEDGALTGQSLAWSETPGLGVIAHGVTFSKSVWKVGTHTLTLTAVDSKGLSASANVTFTVGSAPVIISPPVLHPGPITEVHYGTAELPRVTPTVTPSNATIGSTHNPADAAALNSTTFVAGDTYILTDGVCYNDGTRTRITLPDMASETLLITSNTGKLPTPGNMQLYTNKMATPHFRSQSSNSCPLYVGKNWRLVGIEVDEGSAVDVYGLIRVGPIYDGWSVDVTYANGQIAGPYVSIQGSNIGHAQSNTSWWRRLQDSDLASGVKMDRCIVAIVNWQASSNGQIAVFAACNDFAAIGCAFKTEGSTSAEDHAFLSVTGGAGHLLDKCQLVSSAAPFFTGGSGHDFDTIFRDATIRRCWILRELRMIIGTAEYTADGSHSRISKNLFELKLGLRVLCERCKFENHYDPGANGGIAQNQYYAIVFKLSRYSTSFTTVCRDITFRWNELKNINGGITAGSIDTENGGPYEVMSNVSIYHNWTSTKMAILNGVNAGSSNNFIAQCMFRMGIVNTYFGHNTMIIDDSNRSRGWAVQADLNLVGFIYENNVINWGDETYGGFTKYGEVTSEGNQMFLGAGSAVRKNWIYDPTTLHSGSNWSNTAQFVFSTTKAGIFTDYDNNDFHVVAALRNAGFQGRTPGADIDEIGRRTAHCVDGLWT